MTRSALSLDTVPHEVLEHVAYFSATESVLGPPSGILPLLQTSTTIHSALSIRSNHHLYARVFSYKFDTKTAFRRLRQESPSASSAAFELQRRCVALKRIKAQIYKATNVHQHSSELSDTLWTAYLMLLDNDGKNELQLRNYARMDLWLNGYWFNENGASFASHCIMEDIWPDISHRDSLAMWIFWFLLRPGKLSLPSRVPGLISSCLLEDYSREPSLYAKAIATLKVYALGAHIVRTSMLQCSENLLFQSTLFAGRIGVSLSKTCKPWKSKQIVSSTFRKR